MTSKQTWLATTLPLIPPVLVVAIRFFGIAPASASASQSALAAGTEIEGLDELTFGESDRDQARQAWEASEALLSVEWRRPRQAGTGDVEVITLPDTPITRPVPNPSYTLTTIFGDGAGGGGVIDGRIYRVGDLIDSGWTLISVDRAGRGVGLRHESGAEYTIMLSRPAGD